MFVKNLRIGTAAALALVGALALAAVSPGQGPTTTPTTTTPAPTGGTTTTGGPFGDNVTGGGNATNATLPPPPPPEEAPEPAAAPEGDESVLFLDGDRAVVVAREVGGLRVVATVTCVPLLVGGESGNDAAMLDGVKDVDCDPVVSGTAGGSSLSVTCELRPPGNATAEASGTSGSSGSEGSAARGDEVVDCVPLRVPVEGGPVPGLPS